MIKWLLALWEGVIWIQGGYGGSSTGLLNDLWSYNISEGLWKWRGAEGPAPRDRHVAIYAGGSIWIHGGWGGSDAGLFDDLWSYNLHSGTWTLRPG